MARKKSSKKTSKRSAPVEPAEDIEPFDDQDAEPSEVAEVIDAVDPEESTSDESDVTDDEITVIESIDIGSFDLTPGGMAVRGRGEIRKPTPAPVVAGELPEGISADDVLVDYTKKNGERVIKLKSHRKIVIPPS